MKLNRTELKKIAYQFNSASNRLLQASFQDYEEELRKYLQFLKSKELIMEYIDDCGDCELDLAEEVKSVAGSFGRFIFTTGETDKEEVRNVYATLNYIVLKNVNVVQGVAMGYTSSRKFADGVKAFNDRFVMILIRHIETFLTELGIEMGIDEKQYYNISGNGQVVLASDRSVVSVNNNISFEFAELEQLINATRSLIGGLEESDKQEAADSLDVIEAEVSSNKPKMGFLRAALKTLKGIKGTAEFGAAVVALAEFIAPLMG